MLWGNKDRRTRALQTHFSHNVAEVYVDGCVHSHPLTILSQIPCYQGKMQGILPVLCPVI